VLVSDLPELNDATEKRAPYNYDGKKNKKKKKEFKNGKNTA